MKIYHLKSDHFSMASSVINLKQSFRQLIIYGIIGVALNCIGYLVYLLLVYWHMDPKVAMTLLYVIGVVTSFLANRKFTFADQRGVSGSSWRFIFAHGCGYTINLLLLLVLVDKMNYPHELVQAVAIFIVAVFLFLMNKFFVFKDF